MKRKILILSIIALISVGLIGSLLIVSFSGSNIQKHIELGNKYLEEGNYEMAILDFKEAIDLDENSFIAKIGLSKAYIESNEYEKAEEVIIKAIEKDDTIPELRKLLIEVYKKIDNTNDEIKDIYEKAYEKTKSEKFKEWVEVHTPQRAKVTVQSGNYEEELNIQINNLKEGEIAYYTFDDNDTKKNGVIYNGEIIVPEGRHTLKILVTNEHGLDNETEYTYDVKAKSNENIAEEKNKNVDTTSEEYFIFPSSNIQKLTEDKIKAVDSNLWAFGRNEIFARYGYVFKTDKYSSYFNNQDWYVPCDDNSNIQLTELEKYNADLIKFYEDNYIGTKSNSNQSMSKQLIDIYKNNTEIYVDLNGDNTEEKIVYKKDSNGYYKLYVNDIEYNSHLDRLFDTVNYFGIADIDRKDSYKEILLSTYGPSDDYETVYYYFDGKSLVNMGYTQGLIDYGIKIDGSSEIKAMQRASIIQTWFYDKNYVLSNNHKIESSNQKYYATDSRLKLIDSLKVFERPSKSSKSYIIKANQHINIVMTDDNSWCKVDASDGSSGWFSITNYSYLDAQEKEAYKVFEGLCIAD